MAKEEGFKAKDFDKFHQKTRLELIVRDCWNCQKKTVYIYLGNYGNKSKAKFTYECHKCGVYYTSSKKLKTHS